MAIYVLEIVNNNTKERKLDTFYGYFYDVNIAIKKAEELNTELKLSRYEVIGMYQNPSDKGKINK